MKGKLMRFLPGMITCEEFESFIIGYLDGTLDKTATRKFEWHLRFCRECHGYLDAYRRAVEAGKAAYSDADGFIPQDVPEDLIKAILAARD